MQIEWSTFSVGFWWPGFLGIVTLLYFVWQWRRYHGEIFPDFTLISATASRASHAADKLAIVLGVIILTILVIVLSRPSILVSDVVERTEREFMILLDTSGSMQEATSVLREGAELNYARPLQLGLIPITGRRGERGVGVDSESVPYLARYEVARESIRRFLDERRFGDRVGIIYSNNIPFVVSVVTQNVAAIKEELRWLDDYVALGTLLYRGLEMATNLLESSPHGLKQALILISDAEVTGFTRIQEELDRIDELNVSLHLLWLGDDKGVGPEADRFLRYVESIGGNIFALADLTNETLDAAFAGIDQLESYSYTEEQRQQVNLSEILLSVVQWLVLIWILLVLTVYHPK